MELPDITIDEEGYPTEEFLEWIRTYDCVKNSPFEFIQIILNEWYHGDYGWKIQRKYKGERKVFVSTLGWSGNEEMIAAMRDNFAFWAFSYFSHQRGGHYTFILDN